MTSELLEKIRKVAAEIIGKNESRTVAWVSRDDWAVTLPESHQDNRISLGKPENIIPAIAITVISDSTGSIKVTCGRRESYLLPAAARVDSFGLEDGLEFEDGELTDESEGILKKRAAEVTTFVDGLDPKEAAAFVTGGPIRP